jgi:hypothetical protein
MTASAPPAASGPAWGGPALFVPVTVEALPLTQGSYQGSWSWITPNYNPLVLFGSPPALFEPAVPNPVDAPGPPRLVKTGVLVRWSLPDALTKGGNADPVTGTVPFPAVPNRWLVLRRVPATPAATQSWMVASDYVGGSGSPFMANGHSTTLGMGWPLSAWPGEAALPAGLQPPLTALGLGNPSFAAYLPNVQHIFSFLDPLTGVAPGAITYAIFGWYSAPNQDPLSGWKTVSDWNALLASLGWSVGDAQDLANATAAAEAWGAAHGYSTDPNVPSTFLPSRILCHGLVTGVTWPGASGVAQTGVPIWDPNDPKTQPGVTVAHNAIDALATTVSSTAGANTSGSAALVADALTALLGNLFPLLDEADGTDQLALRLQSNWFQQVAGGSRWQVAEPRSSDASVPPAGNVTPTLPAAQANLLDALNAAQQDADSLGRQIASLQWDIYALWWKLQYVSTYGNPIPNAQQVISAALGAKQSAATAAIAAWQTATNQVITANQTLSTQLGDQFSLQQVPEPPFLRPNDPVVLVQGVGRSFSHGEDGRFSDDGSLYCRFSGQSIAALLVNGSTNPVSATTLSLPGLTVAGAPAELSDLATEAFFLDPGNAAALATAANPTTPQPAPVVAAQQTLVWNGMDPSLDQQTLAETAGLQSVYGQTTVPSKVAVEYWNYPYPLANPAPDIGAVGPPWAPLFLDWSVTYFPTTPGLAGWAFPAPTPKTPLDAQTAQWAGTIPQTGVPLEGRTLLTPQAADALAARLEQLLEQSSNTTELQPYTTDLNDAIGYLASASVLSQALSGFNDLLLQRDPVRFVQPDMNALGTWLHPASGPAFAPTAAPFPNTAIAFAPLRAGFLVLDKLWVIDDFGQRYDVLGAMTAHPSTTGVELGPDYAPAPAPAFAQLRPRLTQPSRLRLRFLDAADDTRIVELAAGANPVCGWLIPNRLDRSVMVYDATGLLLGELLVASGKATWLTSPDLVTPQSVTAPPPWSNAHLEAFVNGILGAADSAAALTDLLATVENASWATVPSGPNAVDLATLVGFPIAVTRAQLLLELDGNPATSQLWAATGQEDDGGINQLRFPVRIGSSELYDDGLVGYLLDSDPAHLSSPYGPTASGYITSSSVNLAIDQEVPLTMLVHPQAKVHVFSGILPPVSTPLPVAVQLAPLQGTEITFRAGPLVSSPGALSAPLPALGRGNWAWLQYDGAAPAEPRPIRRADATAQMVDVPPRLRDGWLRLVLAPPQSTLTYALSPTALVANARTGGTASVNVTAYNGTANPVTCDSITVIVPSGGGPTDLTTHPQQITPKSEQADWTFQASGRDPAGSFVATPVSAGAALPAGRTLSFTLANIAVDQSGLALIGIEEVIQGAQASITLPLETFDPPPNPH